MTNEQLTDLLVLYKQALSGTLSNDDLSIKIRDARYRLDAYFVQNGKEDTDNGTYLIELLELQNTQSNE